MIIFCYYFIHALIFFIYFYKNIIRCAELPWPVYFTFLKCGSCNLAPTEHKSKPIVFSNPWPLSHFLVQESQPRSPSKPSPHRQMEHFYRDSALLTETIKYLWDLFFKCYYTRKNKTTLFFNYLNLLLWNCPTLLHLLLAYIRGWVKTYPHTGYIKTYAALSIYIQGHCLPSHCCTGVNVLR